MSEMMYLLPAPIAVAEGVLWLQLRLWLCPRKCAVAVVMAAAIIVIVAVAVALEVSTKVTVPSRCWV